jgi:hypothetical protein
MFLMADSMYVLLDTQSAFLWAAEPQSSQTLSLFLLRCSFSLSLVVWGRSGL